MTPTSQHAATVAGLALACLLAACGTVPPTTVAQTTAQSPATGSAEAQRLGSRIPPTSSGHSVRQIGSAGAKEMARDRPPEPGPKTF